MELPKFPRHLTEAERRAVRNDAARNFADETMQEMERASGPMRPLERAAALSDAARAGLTLITLNWHEERLAAIEAALARLENGGQ